MQPQTGFADVNGTRLYYEIAGAGEPVVLMHGFSFDTRAWDAQWDAFLQRYRVLRYDLRGFGRSALPDGGAYQHHEDLGALLDHLGIRSAALLGHSTGGSIALDFAVSYPERTRALVLFGAIAGGYEFSAEFGGALQAIFASAREQGIDAAREAWLRLLAFQPRAGSASEDDLRRMVADYSGWHWMNEDPVRPLDPPPMQRLDAIRAPTLTILGERDVPDCHRIAALINQAVPAAGHVLLPGLGHMAHMEAPARFNEAVLAFLARATPG